MKKEDILNAVENTKRQINNKEKLVRNNGDSTDKLDLVEGVKQAQIILEKRLNKIKENLALEEIRKKIGISSYQWEHNFIKPLKQEMKTDLLKLEIQGYIQQSDPFVKVREKTKICGSYGINNHDFNYLTDLLEAHNSTPKATLYSADEFLSLESNGLKWLIPGLLPSSGVTILGGVAGVGKSTLAYDVAGAVIYGEKFLTETPSKTGKVLFCVSDEPSPFIQDKLVNRSIVNNFNLLLDWDVSQWHELEDSVDKERPSLIIMDSFASIHREPNFDENNTQAKNTIYKLNALSDKYNIPILLIHHLGKNKE